MWLTPELEAIMQQREGDAIDSPCGGGGGSWPSPLHSSMTAPWTASPCAGAAGAAGARRHQDKAAAGEATPHKTLGRDCEDGHLHSRALLVKERQDQVRRAVAAASASSEKGGVLRWHRNDESLRDLVSISAASGAFDAVYVTTCHRGRVYFLDGDAALPAAASERGSRLERDELGPYVEADESLCGLTIAAGEAGHCAPPVSTLETHDGDELSREERQPGSPPGHTDPALGRLESYVGRVITVPDECADACDGDDDAKERRDVVVGTVCGVTFSNKSSPSVDRTRPSWSARVATIEALARSVSRALGRAAGAREARARREMEVLDFLAHDLKNKVCAMVDLGAASLPARVGDQGTRESDPHHSHQGEQVVVEETVDSLRGLAVEARRTLLDEIARRSILANQYGAPKPQTVAAGQRFMPPRWTVVEGGDAPIDLARLSFRTDLALLEQLANAMAPPGPPTSSSSSPQARCEVRLVAEHDQDDQDDAPRTKYSIALSASVPLAGTWSPHDDDAARWMAMECVRLLDGSLSWPPPVLEPSPSAAATTTTAAGITRVDDDDEERGAAERRRRRVVEARLPIQVVVDEGYPRLPRDVRIAAIDDSIVIRKTYERTLRRHLGPDATVFVKGATCDEVDAFADDVLSADPPFDLVILDNYLDYPGNELTGADIAARLKRHNTTSVLFVRSANNSKSDVAKYLSCGADAVVPKSIPQSSLVKEIEFHMATLRGLDWCRNRHRVVGQDLHNHHHQPCRMTLTSFDSEERVAPGAARLEDEDDDPTRLARSTFSSEASSDGTDLC